MIAAPVTAKAVAEISAPIAFETAAAIATQKSAGSTVATASPVQRKTNWSCVEAVWRTSKAVAAVMALCCPMNLGGGFKGKANGKS